MTAGRTILMVAFQFPPFAGSSAVQRSLRFATYLPRNRWTPVILTANPRAYETTSISKGNEVPDGLRVHRAFCLDTARHLGLFGRYPRSLATPDRWSSWRPFAVRAACRLVKRQRIDAVWSTFPIATAHAVARDIAIRTGLPWIAEFRDPMWQGEYPPDLKINAAWRRLESEVFSHAARVVVTTPGAANLYRQRFPAFPTGQLHVIHNGYDEEVFQRAQADLPHAGSSAPAPLRLLHSGVIYPSERDPTQLFDAIASLKQREMLSGQDLQLVLRAPGNESGLRAALERRDITDIVRLEPAVNYVAAIQEMLVADGLLILQASNCNAQIPAKLYEYLRARRPILALTDPEGDTARTLANSGTGIIAPLDSQAQIESALMKWIADAKAGQCAVASDAVVDSYSRERLTTQLAAVLDSCI